MKRVFSGISEKVIFGLLLVLYAVVSVGSIFVVARAIIGEVFEK